MTVVLKRLKQFCSFKNLTEILRYRTCVHNLISIDSSVRTPSRSHTHTLK